MKQQHSVQLLCAVTLSEGERIIITIVGDGKCPVVGGSGEGREEDVDKVKRRYASFLGRVH